MKKYIAYILIVLHLLLLGNFSVILSVYAALVPTLDFETAGGYTVTSGTWTRQTTTKYEGSYAIEANNGGAANSSSCFETTQSITSGDSVSFWYNVSSESGYDYLRFYVDGTEVTQWSGTIGWTNYNYVPTAGSHTFRWCYTKDGSVNSGADTARIDLASVVPAPPPPTPTLPVDFETATGYTVTAGTWNRQTTTKYQGSYAIEANNGGAANSSSCFEAVGDFTSGSSLSFWYNVSSESGYDFLRFYNDGTEITQWSGTVGWTNYSYTPTAGIHTLRWCYTKDGSVNSGADTARVDDISVVYPPGPGGVSTGLNLWLKSNVGTSTTTNGVNLTTWNDQSGNGKNATAVTAPTYRNNTTDNLNFYPVVNFNGTSQSMRNTTASVSSKNYFAVVIPTNTTDGTIGGGVPFGIECTNATVNTGTCGLPFGGVVLGSFTAAIPDEVITHGLGSSTNWRSADTGTSSYAALKPMLITVNENATANGTDIYEKGIQINNYSANTYQSVTGTTYSLGASRDPANPFYFNGKVAEVINFNNRLSDSDRIKIESYLSLKYGITMKNGTQNYIASDGTTIMWNSTTAGTYNKDVFGIGRDNTQSLGQVQSKSVNNGGVLTIQAVGEGTNITPTFVDIADKEFFTVANNGGSNTWSPSDRPVGYYGLTRRWKAQEVGDVGTINFDFNVADTNFDIPAPSLGTNYYFIYDSNNNGNLADETPSLMTNLGGNVWRAGAINIANGQIFTIASQASTNNIPTDISLFPTSLNENVATNSVVGSFSTTDADLLDTHTYSLVSGVGDTDNSYFSIAGSNISLVHSPDYEVKNSYSVRIQTNDGNGGLYQKVFTITINNIGETTTSFLDFESALNNYKYTVTSGNWSRSTTTPYAGTYSMQSNNGGAANSQSCFEITHNTTTDGTMDFFYKVSSQAGADYLQFYIDNVQQGAGWSGTVAWSQYTSGTIAAGTHVYKWCYIKDGATNTGTDNAFIDNITFTNTALDTTPPTISSISFASGSLLPGGSHDITINYSDLESGIDTASATIELYKWNGITWGSDISGTGLGSSTITTSSATYPTNNLSFGKYLYAFQISDNDGNSTLIGATFYIDTPEIIIGSGSIDMGTVNHLSPNFSGTVTITVKTIGAAFNVLMNRTSTLTEGTENIQSFSGGIGYGYQQTPYSGSITPIGTNEVIATQSQSINTNGLQNTYTYNIQIGALIEEYQAAGNYEGYLDFGVIFDY